MFSYENLNYQFERVSWDSSIVASSIDGEYEVCEVTRESGSKDKCCPVVSSWEFDEGC